MSLFFATPLVAAALFIVPLLLLVGVSVVTAGASTAFLVLAIATSIPYIMLVVSKNQAVRNTALAALRERAIQQRSIFSHIFGG